jgi:tetratricopeptide (TPR) repeat protein
MHRRIMSGSHWFDGVALGEFRMRSKGRHHLGLLLLSLVAALGVGHSALGQAARGWVGTRVVPKTEDFAIKAGNQVIERSQKVITIYRVERVNGTWLWLHAPGISGWAKMSDIIPYDRAIDYFTGVIRADPFHDFAYTIRALVWLDKNELDFALGDLNEAIRIDPGHAWVFNNRGTILHAKKDYDGAVADYNEAIRLGPGEAASFNNRGNVWRDQEDYDHAIADYNEAIRLDPGDVAAYGNRAFAWEAKKDYDRAIADYDKVIRLEPKFARAYFNRGTAWLHKKDYDHALADFNKALQLDPKDAGVYNNRGFAWQAKKDYDHAIADYNEAIRINPKYVLAYVGRGNARLGKKDHDRAIADFNEAIRLDPNSASPYFGRASTLLIAARAEAGAESRAFLDRFGWRHDLSIYAVLVGHFGFRRDRQDDEARRILDEAAAKLDSTGWLYQLIRYLRGEIDSNTLLVAASDNDKQTEARAFLGLDRLFAGAKAEALEHLQWVKEHGNPSYREYTLAVAELDRLASQPAGTKP